MSHNGVETIVSRLFFRVSLQSAFHGESERKHHDGGRLAFTGTPEQRAADIRAWADAGVTTMMVNVTANDLSQMLDRMEAFSQEVMPLV